jgi:hypothetical protein
MKIACLAAGFALGWTACIAQALFASKGFGVKPITVDGDK